MKILKTLLLKTTSSGFVHISLNIFFDCLNSTVFINDLEVTSEILRSNFFRLQTQMKIVVNLDVL